MPPIRKGDGTAVVPKGISQVRTGDGRILFDGPALPDSELSDYWPITEDDDTTVKNENSDRNLTVEGSTLTSGDGVAGYHLVHDGSDDRALITSEPTFGNATMTAMVWVRPDSTSDGRPMTTGRNGTSALGFSWDDGDNMGCFLNDAGSSDNIELALDGDGLTLSVGDWGFLAVTVDIDSNDAVFYAAEPSDQSVTEFDSDDGYVDGDGNFDNTESLALGGRSDRTDRFFEGATDAAVYGIGTALQESDINDWFNNTKGFYQ